MALYPRRRPSGGRRSRSMPARWEDDTLPRASVPSPADQEDRDELMARIGQRHREAVRTSRSEELHARLAKHAKAVAAIEAERAALDVRARRDAACAWDGPSAANAVARAACPPPPPPRHVEASPATLALVQAENERCAGASPSWTPLSAARTRSCGRRSRRQNGAAASSRRPTPRGKNE